MRISIVLGNGGGAFPVMRRLTRLGLGGAQGPGSQWMSWLHIEDWVGIARFLMETESVEGPVNLAAPNPVTNSSFMRAMRKRFAPFGLGLPAPTPLIHVGAVFLRTEPELVLKSRKVRSKVLDEQGYSFVAPTLKRPAKVAVIPRVHQVHSDPNSKACWWVSPNEPASLR